MIHQPHYPIPGKTPIELNSNRITTASVLNNKAVKSRSNQFWTVNVFKGRSMQVKSRSNQFWIVKVFKSRSMQEKNVNFSTKVDAGRLLELIKPTREPVSSCTKRRVSLKEALRILSVRRSWLALVVRKQTVPQDQLFPKKSPGSRLRISATGVQHYPGLLVIALLSVLWIWCLLTH